jgi:hypothetical protein
MTFMNIEDMPHAVWHEYRDKQIAKTKANGHKLAPNPECDTCDVDDDYVCFFCECDFITLGE